MSVNVNLISITIEFWVRFPEVSENINLCSFRKLVTKFRAWKRELDLKIIIYLSSYETVMHSWAVHSLLALYKHKIYHIEAPAR